jgi:hypothetical protein
MALNPNFNQIGQAFIQQASSGHRQWRIRVMIFIEPIHDYHDYFNDRPDLCVALCRYK